MKLLITHISFNKGTADYYIDFLKNKNECFFVLRHPMTKNVSNRSILSYVSSGSENEVATYRVMKSDVAGYLGNLMISLWVIINHTSSVKYIVGFGGFNILPAILLSFLGHKSVFWGVDYSTRRFSNSALNRVYLYIETLACLYSHYVIQPSFRQEEVRIKRHGLNKEKSIVLPNGIELSGRNLVRWENLDAPLALIYLGSITNQHGLLDFVRFVYLKENLRIPLYIFGGGELSADLIYLIEKNNLNKLVFYFGYKTHDEILYFINSCNKKLVGIAPYRVHSGSDHVYFGDSLKIKEYISYGMSYLTSNVVYIDEELKYFGSIYSDELTLLNFLRNPSTIRSGTAANFQSFLNNYSWSNIFHKKLSKIFG